MLVGVGANRTVGDLLLPKSGPFRRRKTSSLLLVLFTLPVVAYCGWVLSLPTFPSQDGPLHLYYVDIFSHFLAHAPGIYARYYRVGSYLPPYALYWYLLWALKSVVSLPAADKIIVCCDILLNAFAFRYMATRVGRDGEIAAFLVLPVLLNWPLAMGFVNFTLALGITLLAAGLWARLDDDHKLRRRFGFVLLVYVITITHPIPLAILLLGCGTDLSFRVLARLRSRPRQDMSWPALGLRGVCLAAALPAAVYVRRFTLVNVLRQRVPESWHRHLSDDAYNYLHGAGLLIFPADSTAATVYRTGVGLLILAAFCLGARHGWRCWRIRRADAPAKWFLAALVSALLMPLLPHDLNGSQFFAWRLVIVVYLMFALAVAGSFAPSPLIATGMIGASMVLSGIAFSIAAVRLGAVAQRIATLQPEGAIAPRAVGEIVQAGPHGQQGLNYRPFCWAGAHYFRRNGLILYNSAWLDGPQIPLKRNESMGLLEATETQEAPRLTDAPDLFAPGARWNPQNASFFFLEQTAPDLRPGQESFSWRTVELPLTGLSLSACRTADWYCLAPRS